MRTVEEHLESVLTAVETLPAETRPVLSALGRTLAEPLTAAEDIPRFDNSSMDGFAVRFDDVRDASPSSPATLRVVADIAAGSVLDPELSRGEAARIMTGAPLPRSADTVVPFESTRSGLAGGLDDVGVTQPPKARGEFVRRVGGDVAAGGEVLPRGARVGAMQLAAAVAAGVSEVRVSRAPRVAVISTGSELAAPGETLGRGRIPDSNGPLLHGLVAGADAEVVLVQRVTDEADAARDAASAAIAAGADVIVFTGGVSAGAYEPVRAAFEGGELEFARVAMQPGKPQAFGRMPGGCLVFGLPGNPVSVAVSFEVFVRPALLRMQGRSVIARPIARLAAAVPWTPPPSRRQYLPAVVDLRSGTVRPATAGGSGSHLAGGLARAEAFAIVPAEVTEVAVGAALDVMLVS